MVTEVLSYAYEFAICVTPDILAVPLPLGHVTTTVSVIKLFVVAAEGLMVYFMPAIVSVCPLKKDDEVFSRLLYPNASASATSVVIRLVAVECCLAKELAVNDARLELNITMEKINNKIEATRTSIRPNPSSLCSLNGKTPSNLWQKRFLNIIFDITPATLHDPFATCYFA